MPSATKSQRASHRTAAAFEQYVSGRQSVVEGAVFFLESGEHLEAILRIVTPADLVFAPQGDLHASDEAIGYSGEFREPGDEMMLDGRHAFELQDYLAAPFISIVGLTLVRQGSAAGFDAFLQDADTARETGVFVDQLLSSALLLESRASFSAEAGAPTALARVHVTASGELRDGPDGLLLGVVGDRRDDVDEAAAAGAGPGRALARIVTGAEHAAAVGARPWLGRYVEALDLLRQWGGSREGLEISGFGGHLVRGLDANETTAATDSVDAPFLVAEGDDVVLIDRASRRRFRLGAEAARGAECLIAAGSRSGAAVLFAGEVASTRASAESAVGEVADRFADAGIDLTSFAGAGA